MVVCYLFCLTISHTFNSPPCKAPFIIIKDPISETYKPFMWYLYLQTLGMSKRASRWASLPMPVVNGLGMDESGPVPIWVLTFIGPWITGRSSPIFKTMVVNVGFLIVSSYFCVYKLVSNIWLGKERNFFSKINF